MSSIALRDLQEQLHTALAHVCVAIGRRHRLLRVLREQEADSLAGKLGMTVRSGPAAGLRLLQQSSWGRSDLPAKILGVYEQPLQDFLAHGFPARHVLCVGAADGYYGVGMIVSGHAQSTVCFEMNPEGRDVIAATAMLNGVADKVTILGKAEPATIVANVGRCQPSIDLALIDIEGGEYELLTEDVLAALAHSRIVVELHPHLFLKGAESQASLIKRASKYHHVELIDDRGRMLPDAAELRALSDDQRGIICSEARQMRMQWLALTPKHTNPTTF